MRGMESLVLCHWSLVQARRRRRSLRGPCGPTKKPWRQVLQGREISQHTVAFQPRSIAPSTCTIRSWRTPCATIIAIGDTKRRHIESPQKTLREMLEEEGTNVKCTRHVWRGAEGDRDGASHPPFSKAAASAKICSRCERCCSVVHRAVCRTHSRIRSSCLLRAATAGASRKGGFPWIRTYTGDVCAKTR